MDYRIFNMCTDVNACGCMWGCTDTIRESALIVDSEDVNACGCMWGCRDTIRESALIVDWRKSPLPHWGIGTASAVCWSDAVPTELHPQSRYIDGAPDSCSEGCRLSSWQERQIFFFRRWTFCTDLFRHAFHFCVLILPKLHLAGCS